jgi:hypothetical protein
LSNSATNNQTNNSDSNSNGSNNDNNSSGVMDIPGEIFEGFVDLLTWK